jgi:putative sterol carrier protein
MPVSDPTFPASQAFDLMESALGASEADRKEAIKKGGAVFAFTLKNKANKQESWYIDLKKTGTVGKGLAPAGDKPTGRFYAVFNSICLTDLVTLVLSDDDFGKLVKGTAKAQTLFMGGKLKIKGDLMKATRLEPILGQAKAKL